MVIKRVIKRVTKRVTKRQLRAELDSALSDLWFASGARTAAELELERDKARLENVLAIIMNAKYVLEALFDKLTDRGVDETGTYLCYEANNGLVQIRLDPAKGKMLVLDPRRKVEGALVGFGPEGKLDVKEQHRIKRFLADVMFTRAGNTTTVEGPLSLTARNSRRDEVNEPALASVRES